MGVGLGKRSFSSYDRNWSDGNHAFTSSDDSWAAMRRKHDDEFGAYSSSYVVETPSPVDSLPNPDPKNYVIKAVHTVGRYMILEVNYPDCTNYEGNKILLYKDVKLKELEEQESIDPHFSNNKAFHSPIARFEPTKEGLSMAILLVSQLILEK